MEQGYEDAKVAVLNEAADALEDAALFPEWRAGLRAAVAVLRARAARPPSVPSAARRGARRN